MPFSIVVRSNDIPEVKKRMIERATNAARDSAHSAQSFGEAIAPRLTGAFAASLYVSGPGNESDYGRAVSQALQLRPNAPIVGEIKQDAIGANPNAITAVLASAVEYATYLEEGTAYLAPRPTLRPAIETNRPGFLDAMMRVAD